MPFVPSLPFPLRKRAGRIAQNQGAFRIRRLQAALPGAVASLEVQLSAANATLVAIPDDILASMAQVTWDGSD